MSDAVKAVVDKLDDFLIQIPGSSSWEQNYDTLRAVVVEAAEDLRATLEPADQIKGRAMTKYTVVLETVFWGYEWETSVEIWAHGDDEARKRVEDSIPENAYYKIKSIYHRTKASV
jgi:hypothetical protein